MKANNVMNEKPSRVVTITLVVLLASAALGCSNKVKTVTLPSGMQEDERIRMVEAIELAADAYRMKDPEKARDKYKQAVLTYSEFPSAWNNLGTILMDEERFLEAAEAFKTASELAPSDPRPVYNQALVWDKRGYLREAQMYYLTALERDPNYLGALRGSIRIDARRNESSEATLERIKRAIMIEQDDRWIRYLRLQKLRVESQVARMYQTAR